MFLLPLLFACLPVGRLALASLGQIFGQKVASNSDSAQVSNYKPNFFYFHASISLTSLIKLLSSVSGKEILAVTSIVLKCGSSIKNCQFANFYYFISYLFVSFLMSKFDRENTSYCLKDSASEAVS